MVSVVMDSFLSTSAMDVGSRTDEDGYDFRTGVVGVLAVDITEDLDTAVAALDDLTMGVGGVTGTTAGILAGTRVFMGSITGGGVVGEGVVVDGWAAEIAVALLAPGPFLTGGSTSHS